MVSWQSVNVKRGESIDSIAKRHDMTGSYLRATNGALRERKGKLMQAATIMVPMTGKAKIINATFEQKIALKATQPQPVSVSSEARKIDAIVETDTSAMVKVAPVEQLTKITTPLRASKTKKSPEPKVRIHTVRSGDTLYSIARTHAIALDDMLRWNKLTAKSVIQPGNKIRVTS
jgi:membrane-bound lytic murein transglycosylase D